MPEPRILAGRDLSLRFLRPDEILNAEGRAELQEATGGAGLPRTMQAGYAPRGPTEPAPSQAGLPLPQATPPALRMGASGTWRTRL